MRLFFTFIFFFLFFVQPVFSLELDAPPASSSSIASSNSGGFLKKLFSRKKKQKTITPKFDTQERGYSGSVPNLKSEFNYKNSKSSGADDLENKAEEFTPDEFQKSKIDDPLFLDVILNKDRPSQYTGDMLRIMKFLEAFRPVVANHESIQKFNANVNLLDLHARRIQRLYQEKPEGMSPSYYMLLDLAYKAKVLGNLKYDANYYSKFSPVTNTQYDPSYLVNEDNKFLIDLDKTIFQIRQLNN
ncbi:MAG: hypothetical protein LUE64_00075 [Candidatus Gastranaerophilales bacterium]|nr:hypothetical protein [Candidatus Gastranaerophilales bacterium]